MHDIASQNKQAKTGADYFRLGIQTDALHFWKCSGTTGILQREEERDFMVQGKPLGIADLDIHVVAHLVGINNAN
ncbi:hypothetical protein MXM08_18220 [Aeromonas sanarellii]|nr:MULTISPECIES: hypothetical protein [Aeromonas]MEB6608474.1 hypothetical protein [Aeromonas sanarellii]